MKISCILASYNRPKWVRHALSSVAAQTYKNYELIVVDESDLFDIEEALKEFTFSSVSLIRQEVTAEGRMKVNRLSVNINEGIRRSTGDLFCYLADDDFLLPKWFEGAASFFKKAKGTANVYGKLYYTSSHSMEFDRNGKFRFPPGPVRQPMSVLDHNQVMHRRPNPMIWWPEEVQHLSAPDGVYFQRLLVQGKFHRVDVDAAVKRLHHNNLQQKTNEYRSGKLDPNRE